MNTFVFTCGDINGIGPEITINAISKLYSGRRNKFVFVCPHDVFIRYYKSLKCSFPYNLTDAFDINPGIKVQIISAGKFKLKTGFPTEESGEAAFRSVHTAFDIVSSGTADAMITAPLSKTALKLAGHNFPGHTEMIAGWCGRKNYMMMFLSKKMTAGLFTIHTRHRDVASKISSGLINEKLLVMFNTLKMDLGIKNPKIAVLGLNPHAGESGLIGTEETEIISPVIKKHKFAEGPFSPDAFFASHLYKKYDAVAGMYHDQILIPFKMINFSAGVNYTAGLPVVRTSPDHGTAYDIAGKLMANPSSTIEAFKYALRIVKNRKSYDKAR